MSKPVVFLDMDGVLSSPRAFIVQQDRPNHSDKWIDPIAVRALNMLCRAAGAEVVVSSVWRLNRTRDEFRNILERNGFDGALHEDWRTIQSREGFRGDEVREWLERHPDVSRHVILDDDGDFHPGQPLVQTDTTDGLGYRHLEEAFRVLIPDDDSALLKAMRVGARHESVGFTNRPPAAEGDPPHA
jgi:hypothetical protein